MKIIVFISSVLLVGSLLLLSVSGLGDWCQSEVANSLTTCTYQTETGKYEPGADRTYGFVAKGLPNFAISIQRYSDFPLISSQNTYPSNGSSIHQFNYNCAYVPLPQPDGSVKSALLIRNQNSSSSDGVTPSILTLSYDLTGTEVYSPVGPYDTSFYPVDPDENYGTEDPRIKYDNITGIYYLFYTAAKTDPVTPRLALATTKNISNPSAWVRHGLITTGRKSAGLILNEPPQVSHLFYGEGTLQWATTTNLLNYTVQPNLWLVPRPVPYFDSELVEGGPPPMLLSTGDYLFVYNSMHHVNGVMSYNIGFLILNGTSPNQQLFRSPVPILAPELGWETGIKPWLGLTPNVVFTEGMRVYEKGGKDCFMFYYGAADSVIGAAIITFTFDEKNGKYSS